MDTDLLRTWLGLPPGPWPPGDRELLGVGPGPMTPDEVEQRALERMERLRPHQLVQPDLVTEGMNRLAQALIALTAADAATGPAAPVLPPRKPKRPRPKAPAPPLRRPDVLDAEPVYDAEPVAGRAPPRQPNQFLPADEPWTDPVVADEVPAPAAVPAPLRREPPAGDRRAAYAALVRVRKLLRVTEELRPFFGDPGESLVTPARVFAFVKAVRGFRGELLRQRGRRWPAANGRRVARIAGHPLGLVVFRTLVPTQRQTLAEDWARAVDELRDQYARLRATLRDTKRRSALAAELRAGVVWLRENPEWVLVLTVGVAFVIAIIRTVAARTVS